MTRRAVAAVALAAGVALTAGCTGDSGGSQGSGRGSGAQGGSQGEPAYRLVAFHDCAAALEGLRTAARGNLQAWGYYPGIQDGGRGGPLTADDARAAAPGTRGNAQAVPDSAGKSTGEAPGYSGTNTHEAGVDEPDLVKTDGKRIITVQDGTLRVVDATRRTQVGSLKLDTAATDYPHSFYATELLLAGDKALLIGNGGYTVYQKPSPGSDIAPPAPQLLLVDLAGTPRVISKYAMTGNVVDARQVGSTVRVVMRSAPQIERPPFRTQQQYGAAMLEAINRADVEDWLPRYTVDNGGKVTSGRVNCDAVAHPTEFSAASLLTVLTFDLGRGELGNGDPVTVAADGDTVYSNGPALYVANDQRWRVMPTFDAPDGPGAPGQRAKVQPRTEIYKFDTTKPGRPPFVAGGAVDGWLLNQYSMSEWNGHLRIATTTGFPGGGPGGTGSTGEQSESTVYVLRQRGKELGEVGKVGGLGRGERIYSVRFVGGTGYVVTFRQTDPLYTVDLRDPAKPRVTGELKITGYSAYLHPAGDGRLLGIGQEANEQGRTQGTQISLFDVSDPAAPKRLAQHHVKNGHSEAEFDPHAFLYWPKTGLLVVPLHNYRSDPNKGTSGALALRIGDGSITELGNIEHPGADGRYDRAIRRSLVIESTLWTVSQQGLLASDLGTAAQQAWVPFT